VNFAPFFLILVIFLSFACETKETFGDDVKGKIDIVSFKAKVSENSGIYEFKISINLQEAGGATTTIYKISFNLYSGGEIYQTINVGVNTAFANPELAPYRTLSANDLAITDNTAGKVPNKISVNISYRDDNGYQGVATASDDITEIN
jgi:hypothetical protein